jgi:hypothetical protein
VVAPAAALFAAGGDNIHPSAARDAAAPVYSDVEPCCLELAEAPEAAPSDGGWVDRPDPRDYAAASRWRIVSRYLPAGVAPERGLQVRTILAARSISAQFPQIHNIGGVRADALRWHPNGLAIDVMIPNPGSAEGVALGNAIVDFVWQNADRFAVQDTIWRGTYSTPKGPGGSGNGHFDHVHVTTTGGGYPTGREVYPR